MGLFDQGLGGKGGLSPAAIALLGLLAVKGFENRDKLAGMLGGVLGGGNAPGNNPAGGAQPTGTTPQTAQAGNGGLGGLLGGLAGALGGGAAAGGTAQAGEGGLGGLLGGLAGAMGGNASTGSVVSGGLGDLLNSFQQAGHGDLAQSWVKDGPDRPVAPQQVEQAVGPDIIDQLAKSTGMSRDQLLAKLSQVLPHAVDGLTPDSRVPTPQEASAPTRV